MREQFGPIRAAQFFRSLFAHQWVVGKIPLQGTADDRLDGQVSNSDGGPIFLIALAGSDFPLHAASDAHGILQRGQSDLAFPCEHGVGSRSRFCGRGFFRRAA